MFLLFRYGTSLNSHMSITPSVHLCLQHVSREAERRATSLQQLTPVFMYCSRPRFHDQYMTMCGFVGRIGNLQSLLVRVRRKKTKIRKYLLCLIIIYIIINVILINSIIIFVIAIAKYRGREMFGIQCVCLSVCHSVEFIEKLQRIFTNLKVSLYIKNTNHRI